MKISAKYFWPIGWTLGQVTSAKWPKNYFTMTSLTKKRNPQSNNFFECGPED